MTYIYEHLSSKDGTFLSKLNEQQSVYRYTYSRTAKRLTQIDFIVLSAPGNLACLSRVVRHLGEREPHTIILTGIAGSLQHDTVRIGDVVVSDRVKYFQPDKIRQRGSKELFSLAPSNEWQSIRDASGQTIDAFIDPQKRFLDNSFFRFRRDAIIWNASANLINDLVVDAEYIDFGLRPFRSANESAIVNDDTEKSIGPTVHFGAVMGSDWVIDSPEFINFLQKRDKSRSNDIYTQKYRSEDNERSKWIDDDLLSVDTESYGFFRALRDIQAGSEGSQALVVRGISDLASKKEEFDSDNDGSARKLAAQNAVNAALAIIDRL